MSSAPLRTQASMPLGSWNEWRCWVSLKRKIKGERKQERIQRPWKIANPKAIPFTRLQKSINLAGRRRPRKELPTAPACPDSRWRLGMNSTAHLMPWTVQSPTRFLMVRSFSHLLETKIDISSGFHIRTNYSTIELLRIKTVVPMLR